MARGDAARGPGLGWSSVSGLSFAPPTSETGAQLHETGIGWVAVLEHPSGEQPTYHPFSADDLEGVPRPPTRAAVVEAVEARLRAAGFAVVRTAEPQEGTVLASWTVRSSPAHA